MENLEITIEELKKKGKGEYLLLDIRDEMSFGYGHLPEAVNVPLEELENWTPEQKDGDKEVVVYCKRGITSPEAAEALRARGIRAFSLAGGYLNWLMQSAFSEEAEKTARGIHSGYLHKNAEDC